MTMCEFAVWIPTLDLSSGDVYVTSKLPNRGDVIDVCEDNHLWSDRELIDARFVIFKAPFLDIALANTYLAPETNGHNLDDGPPPVPNTLQYRARYMNLDLDGLPADLAAYIADNTRASAWFTLSDMTVIDAMLTTRAPIPITEAK